MGNQKFQMIGAKQHEPKEKLNIVTRSGLATDGGPLDNAKNSVIECVRRSTTKSPTFDLQKENETFLQERIDFYDAGASSSKDNDKGKGIASLPLRSDPFVIKS